MKTLTTQVLSQLESNIGSPVLNRAHAIEWLEEGYGLQSSVTLNTAKQFERALENCTIEITKLTFPECSDDDEIPVHQHILRKLKRVRFKECRFESDRLLLPGVTQWFEDCNFADGWLVSCSRCNHGHTEQGDSLYENCVFSGSVLITDANVNRDSLAQYSSVFWNCYADVLSLYNFNLNTRLWFTDDMPFVRNARLQELVILHSQVSWPIELRRQTLPKIQIHDSELAGIQFHGGKADSVAISDCACEGSCSFEHSEIDKLSIRDTTFKRPVSLSRMVAGDVTIQRVDFEKVLDGNEATIGTQITLKSIRHAVAPDFLDIELSERAKANSDRETYRLIKHSFEDVGNRIEANRFFALEMQAYRQELSTQAPCCSSERLLVAFNHAVSRHGQSYVRPLVALLVTVLVNACLIANSGWRLPVGVLDETLHAKLVAMGDGLNTFAKGFTLFRPVMHPGMEFATLVMTVMMSTFLWHFLVAVRRFRRG